MSVFRSYGQLSPRDSDLDDYTPRLNSSPRWAVATGNTCERCWALLKSELEGTGYDLPEDDLIESGRAFIVPPFWVDGRECRHGNRPGHECIVREADTEEVPEEGLRSYLG